MLKTTDITLKANAGGFEGYASTFYTLDKAGDVVMPGCYKDGLAEFLQDGFVGGSMHNWTAPLGKYTDAYEDAKGLYVKAKFSDVVASKEMRTLMADGVIKKLSVGMEPTQTAMVSPPELEQIWEKANYKPDAAEMRRLKSAKTIRLIEKAQLLEVSPVTIPANDNARIMAFKSWESCPPAFKTFMSRAMQSARQMAGADLKAGRVLSSKNEMKLRAMLEVLGSVSEEITNLLGLVNQNAMAEEEAEETPDQEPAETPDEQAEEMAEGVEQDPQKKSAPVGVVEAQKLALILELV